jgi:hypothetical protein
MELAKRKRGRPPGRDFTAVRTLLMAPEDNGALNEIAHLWKCSAAAAVRRLIREKAAELGLEAPEAIERHRLPGVSDRSFVEQGELERTR